MSIYLDYNATTPCDPRVLEKMLPWFSQWYGNPSNGYHVQGRKAARSLDEARQQIAALFNRQPHEVIFTSGATESNNLAILGLARSIRTNQRRHVVTSAIEHKAVLLPCKKLQEEGFEITVLPVDEEGQVSVDLAREVITERTLLVSLQVANNEIGTLQPIREVAELAHSKGAVIHSDAAQAVGKIKLDDVASFADLLSVSAHKLYGPKGIGCLVTRGGIKQFRLEPLVYGGGQEFGMRSGTSNVPAIVGFGEACRIVAETTTTDSVRMQELQSKFETKLKSAIPTLKVNGRGAKRLPNTSSLTFPGIDGDALLLNLPDVMMGLGSACNSGAIEPSHVLLAMGLSREEAASTVRASLGRFTSEDEIDRAVGHIIEAVRNLGS